jgi:hypothetical protein
MLGGVLEQEWKMIQQMLGWQWRSCVCCCICPEDNSRGSAVRCVLKQECEMIFLMPGGVAEAERSLCEERHVPQAWLLACERSVGDVGDTIGCPA